MMIYWFPEILTYDDTTARQYDNTDLNQYDNAC